MGNPYAMADYYRQMSNQQTKQTPTGQMAQAPPPGAIDPMTRFKQRMYASGQPVPKGGTTEPMRQTGAGISPVSGAQPYAASMPQRSAGTPVSPTQTTPQIGKVSPQMQQYIMAQLQQRGTSPSIPTTAAPSAAVSRGAPVTTATDRTAQSTTPDPAARASFVNGLQPEDQHLGAQIYDLYMKYLGRPPQGQAEIQAHMNAVKGGQLSFDQMAQNIAGSREGRTNIAEQGNQAKAQTFVENMMAQIYDPMRDDLKSMEEKTMLAYDAATRQVGEQIAQLQFQIQQSKGETKKNYEKAMADLLEQQAYLQDQMQSQQLGLSRSYEDSMAEMQRQMGEYQNQTLAGLQSRGILRSGITGNLFNRMQGEYGRETARLGLERGRGMEEIGRAFGLGLGQIAGGYSDLQSGMTGALAGINQQGILSTGQLMGQYGDIGAQRAQSLEDFSRQYQTLGRSRGSNYQTAMMDYLDRQRNFGLQAEQMDIGQNQWQQEFAEQQRQFNANLALQRQAMQGYGGYGGGGYGGGGSETGLIGGYTPNQQAAAGMDALGYAFSTMFGGSNTTNQWAPSSGATVNPITGLPMQSTDVSQWIPGGSSTQQPYINPLNTNIYQRYLQGY